MMFVDSVADSMTDCRLGADRRSFHMGLNNRRLFHMGLNNCRSGSTFHYEADPYNERRLGQNFAKSPRFYIETDSTSNVVLQPT